MPFQLRASALRVLPTKKEPFGFHPERLFFIYHIYGAYGKSVAPIKYRSTSRAAPRPSLKAHTTKL